MYLLKYLQFCRTNWAVEEPMEREIDQMKLNKLNTVFNILNMLQLITMSYLHANK